jgi:hypothetical protein
MQEDSESEPDDSDDDWLHQLSSSRIPPRPEYSDDESLPGLIDSSDSESESNSEPAGAAPVVDSDDEWMQQLDSTGEPPHAQLDPERNKPPSTPTSKSSTRDVFVEDVDSGSENDFVTATKRFRMDDSDNESEASISASDAAASPYSSPVHKTAETTPWAGTTRSIKPPKYSIANGNYIVLELPERFRDINRTEETACALMVPNIYLSTIIATERKTLESHFYVIKNPNPIVNSVPSSLTGTFLTTIVGAFCPIAKAQVRNAYPMRVDMTRDFLESMLIGNKLYSAYDQLYKEDEFYGLEAEGNTNIIRDRSDDTADAISTKTVRVIQFSNTSHNTGSADIEPFRPESSPTGDANGGDGETEDMDATETVTQPYAKHTIIPKILYQPFLEQTSDAPDNNGDRLIIHNSSTMPKRRRGLGALVYCFPALFYYGCGGYEEEREVRMTPIEWVTRCLELHLGRFSAHYGFLAAAFDIIATEKAYQGQYVSMKVKKDAIRKHGLWTGEDIVECVKYKILVEQHEKQGCKPPPVPDKVKDMMAIVHDIKPGMSNMFGSDESRAAGRQVCFGMAIRICDPLVFITHSPDCGGTLVICINTNSMEPFTVELPNILPNRSERKKIAALDPFQSAMYAHRVNQAFIEYFVGWDTKFHGPKREGGALGVAKWWSGAGEPQSFGDIHFHYVLALHGFPPTGDELRRRLSDPEFLAKFIEFVDSIAPPHPPLADASNACPVAGCAGTLQPENWPGEAYRMRRQGRDPATTSSCPTCETKFAHKDVMTMRAMNFAKAHTLDPSPLLVDRYRCTPPVPTPDGLPSASDTLYNALGQLEFQFHLECHTKSCFHITSRNPKGVVCRFMFPHESNCAPSKVCLETGKYQPTRLIGSEYYNVCCQMWSRLSKNNMDIQFLINGESRYASAYTIKYHLKRQRPASSITMKIGLISKAATRTLASRPTGDEPVDALEEGKRLLNRMLYQFTKPTEMHMTMAAFCIINKGCFMRSHEPVYINLKQACASFATSLNDDVYSDYEDAEDDTVDRYGNVRHPFDEEHVEVDGENVTFSIPLAKLRPHFQPQDTDGNDKHAKEASNAEFVSLVCPLTDYWHRPDCMRQMSYIDVVENFHIVKGKPPVALKMRGPYPRADERYWLQNQYAEHKVAIFTGCLLPDVDNPKLSDEKHEFYYKALLVLFKPTDFRHKTLKLESQTYQEALMQFLSNGTPNAESARTQMKLMANYYKNGRKDKKSGEELSDEMRILRAHPLDDFHPSSRDGDAENDEYAAVLTALEEEEVPDHEIDAVLNVNASLTSDLPADIQEMGVFSSEHHPDKRLTFRALPEFTNMQDYLKALKNDRSTEPQHYDGTSSFRTYDGFTLDVKVTKLRGWYNPVPWQDTSSLPKTNDTDIAALPRFADIADVSVAFRLNFWQHVVFETYARHLLFHYTVDIQATFKEVRVGSMPRQCPHLQEQLLGYMGGEAGSGKSKVISAILTFVRLWGRRDTVETMAFMGLAGLNVDGDTIHHMRGLNIYSLVPNNNSKVQRHIAKLYLTIIDETSMVGQQLLGAADLYTRSLRKADKPWGGIHMLFTGDWLQLLAVKAASILTPLSDSKDDDFHRAQAALELWHSLTFVVFLIDNWRQNADAQYADILSRVHWGVATQTDIDKLNTRCVNRISKAKQARRFHDPHGQPMQVEDYFAPMAISRNHDRCLYNTDQIFRAAKAHNVPVFQSLAYARRVTTRAKIRRLQYLDDDSTDKVPFLLTFHLCHMPAMVTKRITELANLKKVSNGLLGFIVGFIMSHSSTPCMGPTYRGDEEHFHAAVHPSGVTVLRFKVSPSFLLFKLRDCNEVLVQGYPPGVVAIPNGTYDCEVKLPSAKQKSTIRVHQFPVIPAYAMTPEKLQGVTLRHDLYVSELDNRQAQILYVVLSRILMLQWLVLTQPLTMEYMRRFVPTKIVLEEVHRLMAMVHMPSYAPKEQRKKFFAWRARENRYYEQAMGIHRDRESSRRSRTKSYMDFMTSTASPVNTTATPRATKDTSTSRSLVSSTSTTRAQKK